MEKIRNLCTVACPDCHAPIPVESDAEARALTASGKHPLIGIQHTMVCPACHSDLYGLITAPRPTPPPSPAPDDAALHKVLRAQLGGRTEATHLLVLLAISAFAAGRFGQAVQFLRQALAQ